MGNSAIRNLDRRAFLLSAPVAAAAGLALADVSAFSSPLAGQGGQPAKPAAFQLIPAQTIETDIKALKSSPGNNNLFTAGEFTVALTVETAKSAKEFEWHEGRDHVVQIIDGSTDYEVGGTPGNGRNTKPGEWLAPTSEGATRMTLKKGDMLMIRRGTPHKRSTPNSVTLFLISPMGTVKT